MIQTLLTTVRSFFGGDNQRSVGVKRHIAASLLVKGGSMAINLALVPLTIHYVSVSNYGIWLTLSSIIGWLSFFDIGFGNGLRNRFAEAKANDDFRTARIYVSTTYAVLSIVFVSLWLLFVIANQFLHWEVVLNAPADMAGELSVLALIVVSFFCLRMVVQTISTLLTADQKPAIASFIEMLGQLLVLVIIFILTKTTPGSLVNLGLTIGLLPVVVLGVATVVFFRGRYKKFVPSFALVDFRYARDILSLGIKFFIIQLGAVVLFQTTNIVITHVLGPEKVTEYNIAFKYFSVLSMTFYIILSPFWSAFTEAYAKDDYSWMRNSIRKLGKVWWLSIPVAAVMLLLANLAYRLWIGDAVEIPFTVSLGMSLLILMSMRFNLFVYLINGIGKIKLQLYVNIVAGLVYIPLAYYLCRWLNLEGVLVANLLVATLHALISRRQLTRLMNKTATGIWNQ